MATLEKPTLRMQPHDEAIFVAGDGRRARRLRRAALVASVLAGLWIVGLGIGMLGFGSLPGVSLVEGSHAESPVAPLGHAPAAAARETARALLSVKTAAAAIEVSRPSNRQAAAKTGARKNAAARNTISRGTATQAAAPPPPAAAMNPAQRTRGWARRDNEAPPGQVRKATAPAPPPRGQGRHVGQTPPDAPPPAAPGQVKKALDPPPPPPKKG